eukprot:gnl/Dysnectes_brevis/5842_a8670_304.p1 GENE.gnl/Dysnectes_brevis/5842_a8670_304~~gnl/Dysnectes_brevis/5842_a8670_304.p1  ORF type:complete len:1658 (+),score=379.47 gnl/Dysnectes_brevis/5842_a8670_304:225-4976(+)
MSDTIMLNVENGSHQHIQSAVGPSPRGYHIAAILDGQMIIHGGVSSSGLLDDVWSFSMHARVWVQLQKSRGPSARSHHAGLSIGHDLLLFGGHTSRGDDDQLWVFTPSSRSWRQLRPHNAPGAWPDPRCSHRLALLGGDRIMLHGGESGGKSLGDLWELNRRNASWTRVRVSGSATPVPRMAHCVAPLGSSSMLVGGGRREGNGALEDYWSLGVNSMWSRIPGGPRLTDSATVSVVTAYGPRLIVVGGSDGRRCTGELWSFRAIERSVSPTRHKRAPGSGVRTMPGFTSPAPAPRPSSVMGSRHGTTPSRSTRKRVASRTPAQGGRSPSPAGGHRTPSPMTIRGNTRPNHRAVAQPPLDSSQATNPPVKLVGFSSTKQDTLSITELRESVSQFKQAVTRAESPVRRIHAPSPQHTPTAGTGAAKSTRRSAADIHASSAVPSSVDTRLLSLEAESGAVKALLSSLQRQLTPATIKKLASEAVSPREQQFQAGLEAVADAHTEMLERMDKTEEKAGMTLESVDDLKTRAETLEQENVELKERMSSLEELVRRMSEDFSAVTGADHASSAPSPASRLDALESQNEERTRRMEKVEEALQVQKGRLELLARKSGELSSRVAAGRTFQSPPTVESDDTGVEGQHTTVEGHHSTHDDLMNLRTALEERVTTLNQRTNAQVSELRLWAQERDAKFDSRLTPLEALQPDLQESLTAVTAIRASTKTALSTMGAGLATAEENIKTMSAAINAIQSHVKPMEIALQQCATDQRVLKDATMAIRSSQQELVEETQEALTLLASSTEEATLAAISTLANRTTASESRLESVGRVLNEHGQSLGQLSGYTAGKESRMQKLEGQLATLGVRFEELGGSHGAFSSRVTGLLRDVSTLNQAVDRLSRAQHTSDLSLTTHQQSQDAMRQALRTLGEGMSSYPTQLAEHRRKSSEAENKLSARLDDLTQQVKHHTNTTVESQQTVRRALGQVQERSGALELAVEEIRGRQEAEARARGVSDREQMQLSAATARCQRDSSASLADTTALRAAVEKLKAQVAMQAAEMDRRMVVAAVQKPVVAASPPLPAVAPAEAAPVVSEPAAPAMDLSPNEEEALALDPSALEPQDEEEARPPRVTFKDPETPIADTGDARGDVTPDPSLLPAKTPALLFADRAPPPPPPAAEATALEDDEKEGVAGPQGSLSSSFPDLEELTRLLGVSPNTGVGSPSMEPLEALRRQLDTMGQTAKDPLPSPTMKESPSSTLAAAPIEEEQQQPEEEESGAFAAWRGLKYTQRLIYTTGELLPVASAAVSGRNLLIGHDDGQVSLFKVPTISSEQRSLAATSAMEGTDQDVAEVDVTSTEWTTQHLDACTAVAISDRLGVACNDNRSICFDVDGSVRSYTLPGANSVAVTGEDVILGLDDGTVAMYRAGKDVGRGSDVHSHRVLSLDICQGSGSRVLASGSADHTIALWDILPGMSPTGHLKGHQGRVSALAFGVSPSELASGSSDKSVRLWDTRLGRATHLLKGHEDRVVSLWLDGDKVLSGCRDGTVRVWDRRNGVRCLHSLRIHGGSMTAMRCMGDLLVSCSNDGEMVGLDFDVGA